MDRCSPAVESRHLNRGSPGSNFPVAVSNLEQFHYLHDASVQSEQMHIWREKYVNKVFT